MWRKSFKTALCKEPLIALWILLFPVSVLAQYPESERPWGRLPYNPHPQYQAEQPKRYNPWAQMRDASRLPPPEYHGEADENAPKYEKPDPAYRELPKQQAVLSDPRAYASPWSKRFSYSEPYYPGTNGPFLPWGSPFVFPNSDSPGFMPWYWQAPGWGGY